MIRVIDWNCHACGAYIWDALADEQAERRCHCGKSMEQVWWKTRQRSGSWDDGSAVMVHVSNDPDCPADRRVRYPGRHDAVLKPGYERVYLRDLPSVNKFEREHKVMNQRFHYDSNGRDPSDWNVGSH
jgi:hypothetical protein